MRLAHLSLLLVLAFLFSACGPSPEQQATLTATSLTATAAAWTLTPTLTETFTLTATETPTSTPTPTETLTPTKTLTATETLTPTESASPTLTQTFTLTLSPTFDFPKVVITAPMAHCRYGPAIAYLHAADLYAGDKGIVWGRYQNSDWLFLKMDKIAYPCWAAPSVLEVSGTDLSRVGYVQVRLPKSTIPEYHPPNNVQATRKGDKVTVTWDWVYMTEDDDQGYMLDVFVCQNGLYIWSPVSVANQNILTYTFTDQAGCAYPSGGTIATVEKHGYTDFVDIPWPPP